MYSKNNLLLTDISAHLEQGISPMTVPLSLPALPDGGKKAKKPIVKS